MMGIRYGFNSDRHRRQGYPDVVTKSQLINYQGWTEGLVRQYLGEPDEEGVNPTGRSRISACLYHVARVRQALGENPELQAKINAKNLRQARKKGA